MIITIDKRTKGLLNMMPPALRKKMEDRLEAGELVALSRFQWATVIGATQTALDTATDGEIQATLRAVIDSIYKQIGFDRAEMIGGPEACIR